MAMQNSQPIENPDIILIGSGIMSANMGALLKCLDPKLRIQVYEASEKLSPESSHGWNNAGTGHAGICELSYTPKREANGSRGASFSAMMANGTIPARSGTSETMTIMACLPSDDGRRLLPSLPR